MKRIWHLAHGRTLTLADKAIIMGILNITPDSFSDGGSYDSVEAAVAAAGHMVEQGAQIIDIGGETTKPNAQAVDPATEQARILPVIRMLKEKSDVILSVDTYHAQTAQQAVDAGAHIINDVRGLQKEPDIARIAAQTGAGVVIMHTGREREKLPDVIEDQNHFLEKSLAIAAAAGIKAGQIVLDPGFGFAKSPQENITLMKRAAELQHFGFPLLAGISRKRFLGAITGREEAKERDHATCATSVILRMADFDIFRVHNVAANRDVLALADTVRAGKA
ncbi:MAG: Dihydropteroate synthase [Candidatus Tokpelaia hoelldobleri]|uniref:Dihydropteroate synthase n=1 Tax=Candidatus Tokpelaia hoelldobleri TaxID=1902579 RepID=A0A1U9JUS8_9HYPH|nr:MAG: Dihydropteroate synthase [Candidatus Tokpelaia hoelldoblerii]